MILVIMLGACLSAAVDDVPTPAVADASRAEGLPPLALRLDVGVDMPLASRTPMASTRADFHWEGMSRFGLLQAGLRGGYSYAMAEQAVVDAALGVEPHALVMLHGIPVELIAGWSARIPSAPVFKAPVRAGVYGTGGLRVVTGSVRAWGRTADVLTVAPAAAVGGSLDVELGTIRLGAFAEWNVAGIALPEAPGVSGDLGGARLGLAITFGLGA